MNQLTDVLNQNPLNQDLDPVETREWIEALNAIIGVDGTDRAHFILERLVDETRRAGGHLPFPLTTEYVNTIPTQMETKSPGDAAMEWTIRSILRWNAAAMVVRANRKPGDLGGHVGDQLPRRQAPEHAVGEGHHRVEVGPRHRSEREDEGDEPAGSGGGVGQELDAGIG